MDLNILSKHFIKLKNINVMVIGDLMLDLYFRGKTERISPEAPVPVVNISKEEYRPGGAANVALNLRKLGASVRMFGVVGFDKYGQDLISYFADKSIDVSGILTDESRPTTVKTRVIAGGQHIVRYDRESQQDIDENLQNLILERLKNSLDKVDAIIFEDYNKGVLTDSLIRQIVTLAKQHHILTAVDPKLKNYEAYHGVSVFKPNLKETQDILKCEINTREDLINAGNNLLKKLEVENVLITLSNEGMSLFSRNGKFTHIGAKAKKIANVSGAGDTVIATLTSFMATGLDFENSAEVANYAASVVVEDVEIIPIDKDELWHRISSNTF